MNSCEHETLWRKHWSRASMVRSYYPAINVFADLNLDTPVSPAALLSAVASLLPRPKEICTKKALMCRWDPWILKLPYSHTSQTYSCAIPLGLGEPDLNPFSNPHISNKSASYPITPFSLHSSNSQQTKDWARARSRCFIIGSWPSQPSRLLAFRRYL